MLSLIFCSLTPIIPLQLQQNIEKTIGVDYEIICVDNEQNKYSIFEAYNFGAEKAQYNHLIFLHTDILFHTNDWGSEIVDKLNSNENVGVLGVAGATVKTKTISPWWISDSVKCNEYISQNILQHYKNETIHQKNCLSYQQSNWEQVILLDGVFLCCKKNIWQQIKFDATTFNGFHFYDLDFSLAAHLKGFKNYVLHNVLIEHHSAGNIEKEWIKSAIVFHKKYGNQLPVFLDKIEKTESRKLEQIAAQNYLSILSFNGYSFFSWFYNYSKSFIENIFEKGAIKKHLHLAKVYFKNKWK